MSEKFPGSPNFYEVSQERRALRRVIDEAQAVNLPEPIVADLSENRNSLDTTAKDFSVEKLGGLSKAKAFLREQRGAVSDGVNENAIRAELGDKYDTLKSLSAKLDDLSYFEFSRLREGASNPYAKRVQESLLDQIKKEKSETVEALRKEEKEDPNTTRAFELVSLRE